MNIRKIGALLASSFILCSVLLPFKSRDVLAVSGEFVSASETVAQINVGWNLGNTLDSYGTWISGTAPSAFETAWGNPQTTESMINDVKNQGFNAIRIPVTWSQHIDANGNVDSAWMARVKEVVDYAYNAGMFIILNVHHDTGEGGGDKVSWIFAENDNYSNNQAKFAGLWTQIANEFKDYDGRLLFEGYNEMLDSGNTWNAPRNSSSYQAVNSYAQLFVDTVRATGGNNSERNLIVNTYVSSVDQAVLDNFVVPTDSSSNHLIAEVHVYAPWGFTGTAAAVNWTPVHSTFGDSDRGEIDDIMNRLSQFSSRTGLPVIIGECGAEYKSNDNERANYAAYLISKAAEKNIKCFWWDNGDYGSDSAEGGYGIYNRNNGQWRTEVVTALVSNSVCTEIVEATTPEPTEVPETTETTVEETTAETTVAETTAETTEATETTTETIVQDETSGVAKKSPKKALLISGGVVIVLGAYVGLFFLGRKHRNK